MRVFALIVVTLISSCIQKYPFRLGDGYTIDYDPNSYFDIRDSLNTIFIGGHVIRSNYDDTFVIVEQKSFDVISQQADKEGINNSKEFDDKFNNSTLRQYWIINKLESSKFNIEKGKHDNVYGPFSKDAYLKKKEELGVPKKLVLANTRELVEEISDRK